MTTSVALRRFGMVLCLFAGIALAMQAQEQVDEEAEATKVPEAAASPRQPAAAEEKPSATEQSEAAQPEAGADSIEPASTEEGGESAVSTDEPSDGTATESATAEGDVADHEPLVPAGEDGQRVIYVLDVKEAIGRPTEFIIRRGMKEAIEANADAVLIHMDTPGGEVGATLEIMSMIARFPHPEHTYTYINEDAISGGAYIACSTRNIYMAPGGVIGAAAVVTGGGQDVPETAKAKIDAVLLAKVRSYAERNGHRADVFAAMVKRDRGLFIEGREIVKRGSLAAFTTEESIEKYGTPPKPLLAKGKVKDYETFIEMLGGKDAKVVRIQPTGAEAISVWINAMASLLITAALVFGYIELQTPGFGIFGILAGCCIALVFIGYNLAGLGGQEAILIFGLGLLLILFELVFFPGLILPGLAGLGLVIGSLAYAALDRWPNDWSLPASDEVLAVFGQLSGSVLFALAIILLLSFVIPKKRDPFATGLDKGTFTGGGREVPDLKAGEKGKAITLLRPSGTAEFNGERFDVILEGGIAKQGDLVEVVDVDRFRVLVRPLTAEDKS